MTDLWVPNRAAEAIFSAQHAERDEREQAFIRRLKAVDPRLGLFRAKVDDPENELIAGMYYVYRLNDGGDAAFWEIRDPITGGFYEPDEAVIEAFRRWDANTHGSTAADRREARERKRKERVKREEEWRDRKRWEMQEQADFLFRCQVPITDGVIGKVKKAAA